MAITSAHNIKCVERAFIKTASTNPTVHILKYRLIRRNYSIYPKSFNKIVAEDQIFILFIRVMSSYIQHLIASPKNCSFIFIVDINRKQKKNEKEKTFGFGVYEICIYISWLR